MKSEETRTVHAAITGRVQGVGYRAWTAGEAKARGLAGWVRNRPDGSVEAVFSGEASGVSDMVELCRRGPRLARVVDVVVEKRADLPETGFTIRTD